MSAGRFFLWTGRHRSVLPSVRSLRQPESLEPIAEPLEVLFHAKLHDLRPVPDRAQMRVYLPHHGLRLVAQLPRDGVGRDGSSLIQRLQPGGAVGVPKGLRPDLTRFEPRSARHPVEQVAHVADHQLRRGPGRREEQAPPALEHPPVEVRAQDLAELGPESHDPVGPGGLEPPPGVRTERDRLTIEAHVIQLEARDLGFPATRQEVRGDRLYTLCERKKRAAEALAYNGLVQSWPEIVRLAREGHKPRAEQGALFGETEE